MYNNKMSDTNSTEPLDITPNANFIYDIKHQIDDIWATTRVYIENNLFNLSDNQDIHMIFPNLYISNYSTTTNKELLKSLSINTIITALPTFNPPYPELFNYIHVPLYDDTTETISQHFNDVISILQDKIKNNDKVLIHCMVGRSRSVTLGLAFLIYMITGKLEFKEINIIKNDSAELIQAEANILNTNNRKIVDTINIKEKENIQKQMEKEDLYIKTIEIKHTGLFTPQENFVIYKKSTMIKELEDIQTNYNKQLLTTSADKFLITSNLINILIEYIRKYRPIAEPNSRFIEELITYTISLQH